MKYMLLIYTSELRYSEMTQAEQDANWQAYGAFNQEAGARGVLRGGEGLEPSYTATTVRIRDGKLLKTDGPFAETKEQLGGFYLLECANLDEAIEMAGKIPNAQMGSIEIRPLVDTSAVK
jgi:hypothetical protein